MKKHVFRIGFVVTMLLGLMMISANAADCACGVAHGNHDGWTPMDQATAQTLFGGAKTTISTATKYYLTENVTIENATTNKGIVEPKGITFDLCLNGKTMDFDVANAKANGIFVLINGATLNIHDCDNSDATGSINYVTTDKAAVKLASLAGSSVFNLYGGNITGFYGSAGVIQFKGGTFYMYEGKFSNISYGSDSQGLFYAYSGTNNVNISGGEIDATNIFGVRSGYSITKNITGGTFSEEVTAADGYVSYNNGDGTWTVYAEADVPTGGDTPTGPVELTASLAAAPLAAGDYYLSGPLALSTTLTIPADVEVNLDLKGQTLTSSAELAVSVVGTLNLSDSVSGGAIKPATDTTSQGVNVTGTLNMTGGAIDGFNNGSDSGAGVVVSGTFDMSGGAIQNCVTGKNGAGIHVAGGTVTISDKAVIANNTATGTGGAINTTGTGGTITITGGEVYGNGGTSAIYFNGASSTMTIKGGSFYNNTATRCIYNQRTKLTIAGGNFGLTPDGSAAFGCTSLIAITTEGTTKITGGSFYFGTDVEKLDPFVYKTYTEGCKFEITGGDMSSYVGRGSLVDGYFCYKIANRVTAGSTTPYQVNTALRAKTMNLELSNRYGLYVRFDFGDSSYNPYKINGKNFTVEWEGGSEKASGYDYRVDRYIAAKDMFNDVTLTIMNGEHDAFTATFSVKDYAEVLLADPDSTDSLKKALSDMLRYGDAAQAYFYEGTADKAATVTGLIGGSSWTIADFSDLSADAETQLYQGSSLSLKNNIIMNLYFAGNVTAVSVNDETVTLAPADNGLQFASVELNLQNVAKQLKIDITADETSVTIYDSVQAYAYRAKNLAVENGDLTALCVAMMNFVISADAHFNTAS